MAATSKMQGMMVPMMTCSWLLSSCDWPPQLLQLVGKTKEKSNFNKRRKWHDSNDTIFHRFKGRQKQKPDQ